MNVSDPRAEPSVLNPDQRSIAYGIIQYQIGATLADVEKFGKFAARGWKWASKKHAETGEVPTCDGKRYLDLTPRTSLRWKRLAIKEAAKGKRFLRHPESGERLDARLIGQIKRLRRLIGQIKRLRKAQKKTKAGIPKQVQLEAPWDRRARLAAQQ